MIRKFHYRCNIDGYEWTWQEDQPLPGPVANIDPQLLNAAVQQYEEEERIKKERAAAYYREQQERQWREQNQRKK